MNDGPMAEKLKSEWPGLSNPGLDRTAQLVQAGALEPPATLQGRCHIDGFEIIKVIGEGGMGVVLLAHDPLQRFARKKVAIKVLSEPLRNDSMWADQFINEAQHMQRLHHDRIVPVLWVSREKLYYVMPYISEPDTERRWTRGHQVANDIALDIAQQLAGAIRYAHGEGKTTHRDIKPENVLIDRFGRAFLTDFGLCRRTDRNATTIDPAMDNLVGSSPYMPPEALEGKADGKDWDIYSFGALLYELLAGRPPYTGPTDTDIFAQIRVGTPRSIRKWNRLALPELVQIAERCMARDPADRYRSMNAVIESLDLINNAKSTHGRSALLLMVNCILFATLLTLVISSLLPPTNVTPNNSGSSAINQQQATPSPKSIQLVATSIDLSEDELTNQPTDTTLVSLPVPVAPTPIAVDKADAQSNSPTDKAAFVNSVGMAFASIPSGQFTMGSDLNEIGRDPDEQRHGVILSRSFQIGTTEVTQAQWKAVMRTSPWHGKPLAAQDDNAPATYVSWKEAVAFCEAVSRSDGKRYRLPTEAEWEYAARAGSDTGSSTDDKTLRKSAWFRDNTPSTPNAGVQTVARKSPNSWGLYDMQGNAEEWCSDTYGRYPFSTVTDPAGPNSHDNNDADRSVRGGSWRDRASALRIANRFAARPDTASETIGFRVVLEASR